MCGLVANALVGGDDHAALAGRHDLGGVERERRGDAERARRTPVEARAVGVGGVLDQEQCPGVRRACGSRRRSGVIAPPMCTSTTPAVSSPSAASTVAGGEGERVRRDVGEARPAPAWITAAAVAKNVFAGTTTSRPSTPIVRRMISIALVPLLTATANGASCRARNASSSSPCMGRGCSAPVCNDWSIMARTAARSLSEKTILAAGIFKSGEPQQSRRTV